MIDVKCHREIKIGIGNDALYQKQITTKRKTKKIKKRMTKTVIMLCDDAQIGDTGHAKRYWKLSNCLKGEEQRKSAWSPGRNIKHMRSVGNGW